MVFIADLIHDCRNMFKHVPYSAGFKSVPNPTLILTDMDCESFSCHKTSYANTDNARLTQYYSYIPEGLAQVEFCSSRAEYTDNQLYMYIQGKSKLLTPWNPTGRGVTAQLA
jgi:hypothetical protein